MKIYYVNSDHKTTFLTLSLGEGAFLPKRYKVTPLAQYLTTSRLGWLLHTGAGARNSTFGEIMRATKLRTDKL